jgi:hypothetical protein
MTTKAQTLHRNYFIDLAEDAQGWWRVTAITHSINGSSLLSIAPRFPNRAIAEQRAKAAIDVQLAGYRQSARRLRRRQTG